jgi:hypothetical protein
MALKRVVAYNAANTADAATKIKDTMVAAGWVLHDDQATASKYYILTSTGEAADQMKVYVEINWATVDKIFMYEYAHWNATAHTGTIKIGSASYVYITADDDAAFWLWVYSDKNGTAIISKVGTAYRGVYIQAITPFWTVKGTLASAATAGGNAVITLGAGEANNFKAGVTYQLVGVGTEGRELVTVNAVNTGANTITVNNLAVGYAANSVVGQVPWPWVLSTYQNQNYVLTRAANGTTVEASNSLTGTAMLDSTYTDPDAVGDQQYTLWPIIFNDRVYGTLGYSKNNVLMTYTSTNYEDSIGITKKDSGTATGGTTTTLTDTGKAWTIDEFAGKAIVLTAGAGGGDVRKIVSNTATEITVDVAFSATPDATSTYAVYDEVWRYFYFGSLTNARAFKEV